MICRITVFVLPFQKFLLKAGVSGMQLQETVINALAGKPIGRLNFVFAAAMTLFCLCIPSRKKTPLWITERGSLNLFLKKPVY